MIEYIDILDEEGNKTGEVLSKKEMHDKSLWHRSVNLWIITPDHKILVQKRSQNKVFPGCWHQSAAGHVSAGETSEEAIIKEAREEIGLKIIPEELEFLFSYAKIDQFDGKAVDHKSHFDIYLVTRKIDLDKIKIQTEEVAGIKLVLVDELEKMVATPGVMLPFPQEYPKIIEILKARFQEE